MNDPSVNGRISRRTVLAGIVLAAGLGGGGYGYWSFARERENALRRVTGRSEAIATDFGSLEYAKAGDGVPVLILHGTGGGFDQGLTFGKALAERGHRIIAPSRFGYLRSAFPDRPSAIDQADALVALLDHLGIEHLVVTGGSAGALPAAAFALRHPHRCSGLILLVPAMNLDNRDPVAMSPLMKWGVRRLLTSDLLFWIALKTAPEQLVGTLLATDPILLDRVSASERQRAYTLLEELMPISLRSRGMLSDADMAGGPTHLDLSNVRVPTLILSVEDDRFSTADTARKIAGMIPDAALRIYPSGGHIWLGHDEDFADEIAHFVAKAAQ